MLRVLGAVVYVGGTGVWALFMLIASGLRCDDACSSPSSEWTDNVNAWQYDTLPPFAYAGVVLALIAVAAAWRLPRFAIASVAAHSCVFIANCFILLGGRHIHDLSPMAWVMPVLLGAVALVAPPTWYRFS